MHWCYHGFHHGWSGCLGILKISWVPLMNYDIWNASTFASPPFHKNNNNNNKREQNGWFFLHVRALGILMFFYALLTAQWRDKLSQLRAKRNLNNRYGAHCYSQFNWRIFCYNSRIITLSLSDTPSLPTTKKEGKPCLITCNSTPTPKKKKKVNATDIVKWQVF